MLHVSFLSRILVALILIGGILVALPNALPPNVRSHLPAWWANQTVSLGLDLQGGSYLLLEVQLEQVQKDKVESLMGDIRAALRKARIGYTDISAAGDDAVSRAHSRTRSRRRGADAAAGPQSGHDGGVLSVGAREYDLTEPGGGRFVMSMTDAYKKQAKEDIVDAVHRSRAPPHRRDGHARTDHRAAGRRPHPGAGAGPVRSGTSHQHSRQTTAKMTFQLVDESADPTQAAERHRADRLGTAPADTTAQETQQPGPIVVRSACWWRATG